MIKIIAVLVAARDGKHAGADHVSKAVHDPRRIAPLGEHQGQLLGHPDAPVGHGEKHDAPIGCQSAAVEGGCDLLAGDGWKRERQNRMRPPYKRTLWTGPTKRPKRGPDRAPS